MRLAVGAVDNADSVVVARRLRGCATRAVRPRNSRWLEEWFMPSARLPVRSIVGVLGVLVLPLSLAAQEEDDGRTLFWRALTVEARLDADGRLHALERHAMVFDGAWNGGERGFDLRLGQQMTLNGLSRIDPGTGETIPLQPGELDEVDEFDWVGGSTLRWRSRLESDPPFRNEEIVYEIEYTLWPVLTPTDENDFLLRHDFAFPDRAGPIERFDVDLEIDPVWAEPPGGRIREGTDGLAPGRGYTIAMPVGYAGVGSPAAAPSGAPSWLRGSVVAGALLAPLVALLALRRRERELDRVAPITKPEAIDSEWLERYVFAYPAEVVGSAWDRAVGPSEVAALLARLVQQSKLSSRVEEADGQPVLHLRRLAPLASFPEHERDLLAGLFFDGRDETDTAAIRSHYKKKGFDPASTIRSPLTSQLETLPGEGRVRRRWLLALTAVLLGGLVALATPDQAGKLEMAILGLLVAAVTGALALGFAAFLSRRVTHRIGPAVGMLLPLALGALLLALLAGGLFEGQNGLVFYRPGAGLLIGLLIVLTGIAATAIALARPTEGPGRLAFRRHLVSAREFFENELRRPEPRLDDAWFPYLLAFGLGSHIDRWFEAFGGAGPHRAAGAVVIPTGVRSGGQGSGGWSGGGPQFGGGSWGGGGAGGSWSMAAATMATGVSPPSSSGGGGGTSSSGGGSGGGW
jgi:uncharacterized membrane protein YgcG